MLKTIARVGSSVIIHNTMPIAAQMPQVMVAGVKCARVQLFLSESKNIINGPKPNANDITPPHIMPSNTCATHTIMGVSAQKNQVIGFGFARPFKTAYAYAMPPTRRIITAKIINHAGIMPVPL